MSKQMEKSMNSYERVMAALSLEQPDRISIMECIIDSKVYKSLLPSAVSQSDFEEYFEFDAVGCGYLLPLGTPEQVEQAVKDCIDQAGKNGGFIITSSNSIHSSVNPENYLALIRATQKWEKYSN